MTKIFVDWDGVCGAFDEHFFELFGKETHAVTDPELWEFVNSYERYWIEMPLKPYAKEMIDFIKSTGLPYAILTGCPRSNYEFAEQQKRELIKNHFGDIEVITCLSKHKPDHMRKPGDILIDDFVANVRRWEKAGGIAIKHYTGSRTIEKLKIILDEKAKEKNTD